ncbi:MAG TPA: hypothetical protein PL000_19125 [Anaerolineales bacterium]|nr:hypothetical protein [Anaerolineales bacterium]
MSKAPASAVAGKIGKRKGEQAFLREWKKSVLSHPRSFWYKIPDIFPMGEMRWIPQKPFDCIFAIDEIVFFAEAKFSNDCEHAWSFDNVSDHQAENLDLASRAGVPSGILLNVRQGLGSRRYNKTFAIGINAFNELRAKKKSIRPGELERLVPFAVPEGVIWPIRGELLRDAFNLKKPVDSAVQEFAFC